MPLPRGAGGRCAGIGTAKFEPAAEPGAYRPVRRAGPDGSGTAFRAGRGPGRHKTAIAGRSGRKRLERRSPPWLAWADDYDLRPGPRAAEHGTPGWTEADVMTQDDRATPDGSLPVTADDISQAIESAVRTLREVPAAAWDGRAAGWSGTAGTPSSISAMPSSPTRPAGPPDAAAGRRHPVQVPKPQARRPG